MNAVSPEQIELNPIEIDPRPCEWCGLTIDQHRMVDIGEGPEFFCNELDVDEDVAEPRDAWRHTGEPPAPEPEARQRPPAYRTAASTIAAFEYVASLGNADYLARWLANHPADAPELFKIWKGKR
jgi:hypothetical protein